MRIFCGMEATDPKSLIKAIGRGKTLFRDLTMDEMRRALTMILDGTFTQAQTGAFLQALRLKETSADEVLAALEGLSGFQVPMPDPVGEWPLVVNVAFDSRRKATILSVLAARMLASSGLASPCLVWSPCLNAGIEHPIDLTLEAARGMPGLDAEIPSFSVTDLVPALSGLEALRRELGFRSVLNTLEKLVRPWKTAPVVLGIAHDTFRTRLAEVLGRDGSNSGAIVQGNHGTCDLGLGEEPTTVIRYGQVVAEDSVSRKDFPWEATSAIHLLASKDQWPTWLSDRGSPLWNAVRIQASFLLSVARPDLGMDDCIALVNAKA